MSKIGFVFRSHPHSSSKGREGLDALLATSAYSEDISVFFIGAGVTQLLAHQETGLIHSRNYSPAFRLMDLYDIEEVYICQHSLIEYGLEGAELIIDAQALKKEELQLKLQSCKKLLTF